MTGPTRRLELAEAALSILAVLPAPADHPVFTGWVSNRIGADTDSFPYWCPRWLHSTLGRLARRGLVERHQIAGRPYWRLTEAGQRYEGTAEDLARPIRGDRQ